MKKDFKYQICDLNYEKNEEFYIAESGRGETELRHSVVKLLKEYYELNSEYGDPINDIIPLINIDKFEELLSIFNYELKIIKEK